VANFGQEFVLIFGSEVVAQQAQRCEVQLSLLDQAERDRKFPGNARGRDAMERLAVAQAQHVGAIVKE